MHVGEVVRRGFGTFVYNLEGRRTDTAGSAVRVRKHAHHHGMNCHSFDEKLFLPLLSHCRIVCLDVRKVRWCSSNSVTC